MQRPLFHLLIFLLAGQLAATILDPPLWSLFAGLGVLAAAQAWLALKPSAPGQPMPATGALILAAFALIGATGQELIDLEDRSADRLLAEVERDGWLTLSGTVEGAPEQRPEAITVTLGRLSVQQRGRTFPLPGRVRLSLVQEARDRFESSPPLPGQIVGVLGLLRLPRPPGNPDLLDSRAYLRSHGCAASMSCSSTARMAVVEPRAGIGPLARFQRAAFGFRQAGVQLFDRAVGSEQSALLRSMLLGESYALGPEGRRAFVRSGLFHLFSVSGLHAALIGLVVFVLLRLLGGSWRVSWAATALLVWAFAALVGFQAPVVRTAIMTSVLALGNGVGRQSDGLNTLSLAGLVMLLAQPRALYMPDFQLSCLSILSIVVLGPVLRTVFLFDPDRLGLRRRAWAFGWNRYVGQPLILSTAAQFGLMPVLAYTYHQISFAAFFTNVAILPLGSLGVALGFLLFVFGHLSDGLAAVLGWLCRIDLTVFGALAQGAGNLRWAAFHSGPMPWWAVGAYYAILFSGGYVRPASAPGQREKARSRLAIHLAALAALIVLLPLGSGLRGELMVRLLDVGQGDAIYIEFPTGQNLLIDAGQSFPVNMGERVVAPYLQSHGVRRLSAVVATHADSDHIGGLSAVLRSVPTGLVLHGPSEADTVSYRSLLEAVRDAGALWKEIWRGDGIGGVPGAKIQILSPSRADAPHFDSNDSSLVVRLDYGEVSILFTADAERRAEEQMLGAGAPLDCDYMTAGHHGSRASSNEPFLAAVTPQAAFISCGRRNRYGHPNAETLERFARLGAAIYRTDLQGSIALFSDGWTARIETMRK